MIHNQSHDRNGPNSKLCYRCRDLSNVDWRRGSRNAFSAFQCLWNPNLTITSCSKTLWKTRNNVSGSVKGGKRRENDKMKVQECGTWILRTGQFRGDIIKQSWYKGLCKCLQAFVNLKYSISNEFASSAIGRSGGKN